ECYSRAITLLERVRQQDLTEDVQAGFRDLLLRTYGARALARRHSAEHLEAAADWGRIVELESSSPRKLGYRTLRAESLARARRHREAMAEVSALTRADLLGEDRLAPSTLFRLGKVCSLSAAAVASDEELAADERARREAACCQVAMRLFDRAFAGGYLAG